MKTTIKTIAMVTAVTFSMGASASLLPANTDEEIQFLYPGEWRAKMVEGVNAAPLELLCKGELIKAHFPSLAKTKIKDYKFQAILAKQRIANEGINCYSPDVIPLGKTAPELCSQLQSIKDAKTAAFVGALFSIYDNSVNSNRYGYSDVSGTYGKGFGALLGAGTYDQAEAKQKAIGCAGYEKKSVITTESSSTGNWNNTSEEVKYDNWRDNPNDLANLFK